jgi:hypothetical protein
MLKLRQGIDCAQVFLIGDSPMTLILAKQGKPIRPMNGASALSWGVWAISILVSPTSAFVVPLHSDTEEVMFMALALAGVVIVIRPLSAWVDMNDPWSRFALAVKYSALFFTVMFIVLAIPVGTERTELRIQNNGQRAMGNVVRFHAGYCGKRSISCAINVEYAFTPTSEANRSSLPIHGDAQLSPSDRGYDPNVVYAHKNMQVPIAYEVDHPELSALNFNDDVFRVDHVKSYRSAVARLGKLLLGVFLATIAIAGLTYWLNPGKLLNPD